MAANTCLLLYLHKNRGDLKFLKNSFRPFADSLIGFEYMVLSLPAFVLFAIHKDFLCMLTTAILVPIIVKVNFRFFDKKRLLQNISIVPNVAFELKSGIRSTIFASSLCVLIGTAFGANIIISVIAIFILTIIFATYNISCESRLMVEVFRLSPHQYLLYKIWRQTVFSLCCLAPINLTFMYFHGSYWYILLFVNAISLIVQTLSICFKYAMYIPNQTLRLNRFLLWGAIGCFFIVYFAPIPVALLVIYYNRAINNLNAYLYVKS
ncbi:hypothetical protein C5745_17130 [Sphingobacterium haloxyli]|uniref:Uncharacterized protein n=1 Tax=Sphingobacterium haloxyli TaxID=2100533 RepID=A0A2S9J069_9SPHI|nr:hypothetical protein C5745_17130 [Sphingobacterium haloxyli]